MTPSSTAAPSPLALCAITPNPCPIAAGTYSSAPFIVPFLFTVGDGWTDDRAWPHGGEIALPTGAVQWATAVSARARNVSATPADFIAFLRKTKGFTVSQPTPVTIDGVSGQQVDVLTNKAAVSGLFSIEEDAFNVNAGERFRFFVLDKGGETVILTIDAFKAKQFDEFAGQAQPVIDSIKWL